MELGLNAYWQGNFQRAVQLSQEGITICREIHDGLSELLTLCHLGFGYWGTGNYAQAFRAVHEGIAKAKGWESPFNLSRLTNTLGFDYLALGQHERARSYFEPTLERVEREAFGSHRWRWKIRLLTGLAELAYTTGDYEQALRYIEEGLQEVQATSSQKYIAKGWALHGKIIARRGDSDAAGAEFQRAFTLAEQLQSPSILYPIAYDLGRWCETVGQEQAAAALYGRAKATVEQMVTAVEDEALRSVFLQSALVQAVHASFARAD